MLEIREQDWEDTVQFIQDQKAEIEFLKKQNSDLDFELQEAKTLFNVGTLKAQNEKLKKENERLNKAFNYTNATLSVFTEHIKEAFDLLETHGLLYGKSKISSMEISELLDRTRS